MSRSASKALSRPEDCLPSEQLPDDKLEDGAARAIAGSQDGQPMAKVQDQNSDEDHEFHGQAVNAASEKVGLSAELKASSSYENGFLRPFFIG